MSPICFQSLVAHLSLALEPFEMSLLTCYLRSEVYGWVARLMGRILIGNRILIAIRGSYLEIVE